MEIGTTLLEYGADTNAVTRQGISPIHLAAQEGSVDLVSLLLAKNANVNMCNKVKSVINSMHTHTKFCTCTTTGTVLTCFIMNSSFFYMILLNQGEKKMCLEDFQNVSSIVFSERDYMLQSHAMCYFHKYRVDLHHCT